ncbi:hypothetical protein [Lentisalinibacter orientalis]|uniref:hypothetical protein n=1 Tax=Lentisalinibacter orientalis TaxID=2992241 RepID=UPI00386DE770
MHDAQALATDTPFDLTNFLAAALGMSLPISVLAFAGAYWGILRRRDQKLPAFTAVVVFLLLWMLLTAWQITISLTPLSEPSSPWAPIVDLWLPLALGVVVGRLLAARAMHLVPTSPDSATTRSASNQEALPRRISTMVFAALRKAEPRHSLLAAACLVLLTWIFPPYSVTYNNTEIALGWGLIFSPPEYSGRLAGSIDVSLLVAEWIAILIVCGLSWLYLWSQKSQ